MFIRNHSAESVVAEIEAVTVITQGVFKAIADHGGNVETLNTFVQDIQGGQKILKEIAKRIVSPLWLLTEQPMNLEGIDFEKPMQEFCADYPTVQIANTLMETDYSYLSFKKPKRPCTYRLAHLGPRRLLWDEMLDADLGENTEHAGWRELIAYTARLSPSDFRNCRINAAGWRTHSKGPQGDKETTHVPAAVEHQDELLIAWSGVGWRGRERKFGPDAFYLVRVYD